MNGLLLYFSFICTIGLSCCTRTPDEKLFVVEDGGLFYPFAYTERYGYTPTGQLERAEYSDGMEQWRKSDSLGNLYPDPDCTVRRFLKGGAIMDIREASEGDVKIVFHDKKGRVTLINPDQADDWKIPNNKHRKLKGGCNNE